MIRGADLVTLNWHFILIAGHGSALVRYGMMSWYSAAKLASGNHEYPWMFHNFEDIS